MFYHFVCSDDDMRRSLDWCQYEYAETSYTLLAQILCLSSTKVWLPPQHIHVESTGFSIWHLLRQNIVDIFNNRNTWFQLLEVWTLISVFSQYVTPVITSTRLLQWQKIAAKWVFYLFSHLYWNQSTSAPTHP